MGGAWGSQGSGSRVRGHRGPWGDSDRDGWVWGWDFLFSRSLPSVVRSEGGSVWRPGTAARLTPTPDPAPRPDSDPSERLGAADLFLCDSDDDSDSEDDVDDL